jgi:hypothetical protein
MVAFDPSQHRVKCLVKIGAQEDFMKNRLMVMIVLGSAGIARAAVGSEDADADKPASEAISTVPDDFAPLTKSERLRLYVTGTFGPKAVAEAATKAGVNQLTNSPSEWGQSAGSYGTRLGSGMAQHVIRGTLEFGLSSIFHEDNRYFRSHRTGFWHRTGYAIESSFLARKDNGDRRFSVSAVGSAAGSSFISRAWMPSSMATAGSGAATFGVTIGADVGIHMLQEFWPDIKSHLFHRHKA